MEGRVVRNFQVQEQIGTGGMGVIYRAIQLNLDRPVALKELHPHLAKDADFLRRFEREAKAAAALSHENIVGVIDYGKEGDSYFIAMEYVDGSDLRALMNQDLRIVLPVAVTVAMAVLHALEHAHQHGVIHRDVKPANVMVTRTGKVKLADFSAALAGAHSSTVTGATIGTPAYMSPEQASGMRKVDSRTDLFSTGVILYEMLAGQRPFDGESYGTILGRLLTFHPPDLAEIDRLVPQSFSRIVARALEKDPDRRYATAGEFARDLAQAAADEKVPLGNDLVRDYVKDPKAFQDSLRLRQARERKERGLYLASQGREHADEAMSVLRDAIALDPSDEVARSRLVELKGFNAETVRRAPRMKPAARGAPALAIWIGIAAVLAFFGSWQAGLWRTEPGPTPAQTALLAGGTPLPDDPGALVAGSPLAVVDDRVIDPEATATLGAAATPDPAAEPARLRVIVKPWAHVWVDGTQVGTTPMADAILLAPGSHAVVLKNDRCLEAAETIVAASGEDLRRDVTLTCR